MAFFSNHAGFNITGDKLQLVEVDYKETEFYLENVDEEFFAEFLDLSFSETKIINILQNTYNELILRKPLETNYVSFSFPHNYFKVFQLPVDSKIKSNDLRDHLKWEVSVLFPDYDPDNFIVRHIENEQEDAVKNSVVFAAFKKYLKAIHKFCVRNSLLLKYVDNAHIAADIFLMNKSNSQSITSILLEEKSFSISVLKNNQLEFFKAFQINNIAEFLEKLKHENNSSLILNNSDSSYISGNFISENLLSKLHETTGNEFSLLNPFEKLKISSEMEGSDFINNKSYSFSSAAGIALRLI